MKKTQIIIDTDIAFGSPSADIDDAVALLFAIASSELDIKAIIASGGNAPPDKVSRNLDAFLSTIGANIPHSFTHSLPIDPFFWVNGRWSKSEEKIVKREEYPDLPYSYDLLYESVKKDDTKKTIVTIGPMTNVAFLLLQHPDAKDKIEKIVSMGGSIHKDGVGGGPAEFNIKADPEAASVIFSSGIPLYLFPLDVTKKKKIYPQTIASWKDKGPFIRSLCAASTAFMRYRAIRDGYNPPYAFFHDILPLAYLVSPDLFEMKETSIAIDLKGNMTRGVTLFDFNQNSAYVAVDVDSDAVFSMAERRIMERFGTL